MPIIYGIIGAIVGYIALVLLSLVSHNDFALLTYSIIYLSAVIFGCAGWIVETVRKHDRS